MKDEEVEHRQTNGVGETELINIQLDEIRDIGMGLVVQG